MAHPNLTAKICFARLFLVIMQLFEMCDKETYGTVHVCESQLVKGASKIRESNSHVQT